MSHDQEHHRINKALEALATAARLKMIPCPATDDDYACAQDLDACVKGQIDFGRGARDCPICDGASVIFTTHDGYCACPDGVGHRVEVRSIPTCSKCRQSIRIDLEDF